MLGFYSFVLLLLQDQNSTSQTLVFQGAAQNGTNLSKSPY
jgi:hypothetical protein